MTTTMHSFALAALVATAAAGPAQAALFSDPALVPDKIGFEPSSVLSFDGIAGEFVSPAAQNVRVAADPGASLGAAFVDFGANGAWSLGKTGLTLDVGVGTLAFDWAGKTVSAVGGFLNYYRDPAGGAGSITLAIYDSAGAVLDSRTMIWDFAAVDDFNLGTFKGFTRGVADIAKFTITGDSVAIDDLGFTTPVPEPSTYAMLLGGLALLGFMARRRLR